MRARLIDGGLKHTNKSPLEIFYDLGNACNSPSFEQNRCDWTVIICHHGDPEEAIQLYPVVPSNEPCDREDWYLLAHRDGPFCETCRLAEAWDAFKSQIKITHSRLP